MAGFGPGRTHGSATLGRQMLVGEPNSGLVHFTIDAGANISAEGGVVDGAIDRMYEVMASKGTPVIMGTLQSDDQSINPPIRGSIPSRSCFQHRLQVSLFRLPHVFLEEAGREGPGPLK